jgi:hypothetical protein
MKFLGPTLMVMLTLVVFVSPTAAQINRRVTMGSDIRRPGTSPTPEPGPQVLELRCRGGGLQIEVTPTGRYVGSSRMMNMTIHFRAASEAAGVTGQSLAPGQCALPDRALLPSEPTEMRAEEVDFAQLQRQMHGDPVYQGDAAAEHYPDAQNIAPYLNNPSHYWSFFGFNTFDGYFRVTNQHYWKPIYVPNSPDRVGTPGRGPIKKIGAPESSVTKLDPDPIPSNAVRIYVRYSKDYGYVSTSTAFGNVGPYSCNAFTVDAHTGGLGSYKSVGSSIVNPATMRTEGSYYVCGFTITGLPQNQTVSVSAGMVNDASILTGAWLGEGRPRPPRGYERTILRGLQSITLTSKNTFEIVTFEMVYAPASMPPR